jgi:hypothetical protein
LTDHSALAGLPTQARMTGGEQALTRRGREDARAKTADSAENQGEERLNTVEHGERKTRFQPPRAVPLGYRRNRNYELMSSGAE